MTRSLFLSPTLVCVALYGRSAHGQIENITFLGGEDAATVPRATTGSSSTSSLLSFFSSNPFSDIVSSAGYPAASDAASSSSSLSSSPALVCQSLESLGLNTSEGKALTSCSDLLTFTSLEKSLPAALDDTCRWRELPSPMTQKGMDECIFLTTAQVTAARKETADKAEETSRSSFFPSFLTDIMGGASTERPTNFNPTLPLCCRAAVEGNETQQSDSPADDDTTDTMPAPTTNPSVPIIPPAPIDEGPQCEIDCLLFDDGGCRACLCDQGAARECITYGAPSATCREAEHIPRLSKKEHANLLHRAEVELVRSLHNAFSSPHKEQEQRSLFTLFSAPPGSPRCLVQAPSTPINPTPTTVPELPLNPICTTGCSSFFDGCNTCQCDPNNPNGPVRCTRKACPPEATFDTPFCVDDDGRITTPSPDPEDCDTLVCTAQYDPVCGTDGMTYSNTCQLNIAQCKSSDTSITVASVGVCPDDNDAK